MLNNKIESVITGDVTNPVKSFLSIKSYQSCVFYTRTPGHRLQLHANIDQQESKILFLKKEVLKRPNSEKDEIHTRWIGPFNLSYYISIEFFTFDIFLGWTQLIPSYTIYPQNLHKWKYEKSALLHKISLHKKWSFPLRISSVNLT